MSEDGLILPGEALTIVLTGKGESAVSNSWRPPRQKPSANNMPEHVSTSLEAIWVSNAQ